MVTPSTSTDLQPAARAHGSAPLPQAGAYASAADQADSVVHAAAEPRRASTATMRAAPAATTVLYPMDGPLPPARRLVVLVPDANVDEARLAERVWSLASPRELDVLYLGTLRQPEELFRARRRLAMLAAITTDPYVHVETALDHDRDWVAAVRNVWRPGDLIVCHDELTVRRGFRRRPAAQVLLQALNAPVCLFAGFYHDLATDRVYIWVRIGAWIPPLAIIAVFFGLQGVLTQAMAAPLRSTVLVILVILEFILIAAWEHFLGNL